MFRNSHIPRGLSVNARNSTPCWRRVFMALVLAIIVGSAGQPLPAQAAPARATGLQYFMEANKVRSTAIICVGDHVGIDVRVIRA